MTESRAHSGEQPAPQVLAACDLTPMQRGILFEETSPSRLPGVYVLHTAVELRGEVEIDRLRHALEEVVRRHEALRTTFVWEDIPQPVQVIWATVDVPLEVLDWTSRARGELLEHWESLVAREGARGFDLEQGPLVRATLVKAGPEEAILLLTSHHLVVDGWSLMVILRELFDVYGGAASLQDPGRFQDYVGRLRERADEHALWTELLAGARGTRLGLTDGEAGGGSGQCTLRLNELRTRALIERARELEVTPASIAHAAWALVLRRYAREDDVVFGTVFSGRFATTESERDTVGPHIHTLPFRTNVGEGQTVAEWLKRVHGLTVTLSQQQAPLAEIARAAGLATRDLFESVLVFENLGAPELVGARGLAGLQVVGFRHLEKPKFPIELAVFPGARLDLVLRYRREVVPDSVAPLLLRNYRTALEALVAAEADSEVSSIDVLSRDEEHAVLRRHNATAEEFPTHLLTDELLRDARGGAAIVGRRRRLSHAELTDEVRRASAWLAARGLGVEDRILIDVADDVDRIVATLAAFRAGVAVCWLPSDLPAELVEQVRSHGELRLLVSDSGGDVSVEQMRAEEAIDSIRPQPTQANVALLWPVFDDALEVAFVEWSHEWLCAVATWGRQEYGLRAGDTCVCVGHGERWPVDALMGGLLAGAVIHLVDESEPLADHLGSHLEGSGSTKIFGASGHHVEAIRGVASESVDLVVFHAPPTRLPALENTAFACVEGFPEAGGVDLVAAAISGLDLRDDLGRPVSNVRCYVLDHDLEPVPTGATGQLMVTGVGVARGYSGNAAATAEHFMPDPNAADPGSRLFATGRRVRWTSRGRIRSADRRRPPAGRFAEARRRPWMSRDALGRLEERSGTTVGLRTLAASPPLRRLAAALSGGRGAMTQVAGELWRERWGARSELALPPPDPDQAASGPSRLELSTSVIESATALARALGVEPSSVLLAAWAAFSSQLTGAPSVTLGSVGSAAEGTSEPRRTWLRVNVGGPFRELVEQCHAEVVLMGAIQASLELASVEATSSLGFEWVLAASRTTEEPARGRESLILTVVSDAHAWSAELRSPSEAAGATALDRWIHGFVALLARALECPGLETSELSALGSLDLQLIEGAESAAHDWPRDETVWERFEEVAADRPEQVALAMGRREMTYGQLSRRSDEIASALLARGGRAGGVVGLLQERSFDLVASILGCWKLGAAYVPMDPTHPAQRLQYAAQDAGARWILADARTLPELQWAGAEILRVEQLGGDAPPDRWEGIPGSLAYVLYTSGSTGRPKGVEVTHSNLVNLLASMQEYPGFRPGDSMLATTTVAFDISVVELWLPLTTGGSVVLTSSQEGKDPAALAALLARHRPTVMQGTPASWRMMVDSGWTGSALRAHCAGEALPRDLADLLLERGVELWNLYGPTETTVYASGTRVHLDGRPITIGRPVGNTSLHVFDRGLRRCPVGVTGELFIGGAGVSQGYRGRSRLTAERFLPDPFGLGARIYRSGDLARWLPSGELDCLGRVDHQVKIRGFRIELGEIEAVARSRPEVEDAVAWVHGEGVDRRLVLYVVGNVVESALLASLSARLPDYMVPGAVVTLPRFPLTPAGKVDRRALPEHEAASVGGEAASTPTERALSEIWRELLGRESVAREDDFFKLGGHSVLATRLQAKVRDRFGVELSLQDVFAETRLSRLAEVIDEATSARLPPIETSPRRAHHALSFAQERLWFLAQLSPDSTAYQMPALLRLRGELDISELDAAFGDLVARHETLRTTLIERDGVPSQVVRETVDAHLRVVDFSESPSPAFEVERFARREMQQVLELSEAPLLRITLMRVASEEHLLAFVMHHVISDGWSLRVLVRDLTELYASRLGGRPASLPELMIQYVDYAAWQRAWLATGVMEEQVEYWRTQLASAPPVLELPTDHPRPAARGDRGGTVRVELAAGVAGATEQLASQLSATPFMVLLAAWKVVLAKYARATDIVVGIPVAGRRASELEDLIGFFVNSLAIRVNLGDDPSFDDVVRRVREAMIGALGHQDVPFERLVAELGVERNTATSPVFQVMLSYDEEPTPALNLPGLDISLEPFDGQPAKLDLSLGITRAGEGFHAALTFDASLFERDTASRVLQHFASLLDRVTRQPSRRLSELGLVTEAERTELERHWNAGDATWLPDARIEELFEAHATARPDAIAVVHELEQLSFAELDARANQLARHLISCGVRPDDRVVIWAERSIEAVVALLGVLKAGAGYVAIDPAHPLERAKVVIEDAQPRVVLGHARHVAQLVDTGGARALSFEEDGASWEALAASKPDVDCGQSGLLYITYTSGSTGKPKGVAVAHRNMVNYVFGVAARLGWPAHASHATVSTLAADLGNTAIYGALCRGGALHVVSERRIMDPAALAEYLATHRVDCLKAVPPHMQAILRVSAGAESLPRDCLILGGEAFPRELAEELLSRGGPRVFNHYGPSETTVGVSTQAVDSVPERGLTIPVGLPLPGSRLHVVDPALFTLPVGVPGELWIGGAGVTRGYWERPRQTAERFMPDAFGAIGERVYRSGDLVRRFPDGRVEFLGRMDHQVKVRGHRVEPGEIEAALRSLDGVDQAVVLARRDASRGVYLAAYVVAHGRSRDPQRLEQRLAAILPSHMVPAAWVLLEALPLTPNKKVDRKALPEPEWQTASYEAPASDLERSLAALWQELLGVRRVGRSDDFFALGGHSLLATRLVSRIRREHGVEVQVRDVFELTRLSDLASLLARASGAEAPTLRRVDRARPQPLSFAQERMWLVQQLHPDSGALNMAASFRAVGDLDVEALAGAVADVQAMHETLRTRYRVTSRGVVQEIAPEPLTALEVLDLRDSSPDALTQVIEAEKHRPFDLMRDGPFRVRLHRCGAREHVLTVVAHHISADGWSLSILVPDLVERYRVRRASGTTEIVSPDIGYVDFAEWQRSWLVDDELERQLAYWRDKIGDAPLLELPLDHHRPARQTFEGRRHDSLLRPELVERLKDMGVEARASLNIVLLAVFKLVLGRLAHSQDVVVGSPIAGRRLIEVEQLVGCFVNSLVLRTDLSGDPSFLELLGRVRETVLEAQRHQDIPFEKLLSELRPDRDLSRTPWFQVFFNMVNVPSYDMTLEDVRFEPFGPPDFESKFDMTLYLRPRDQGMALELVYNPDLFDRPTIERWSELYRTMLEEVVADPERPISTVAEASLSRLGASPAPSQPVEPGEPRSGGAWVLAQLERSCDSAPRSLAIDVGEGLTYGALSAAADTLTAALRARLPRRGALVGIASADPASCAIAIMACLRAAAPFALLDERLGPAWGRKWREALEPALILVDDETLGDVHGVATVSIREPAGAVGGEPRWSRATSDEVAWVHCSVDERGTICGCARSFGALDRGVRRELELLSAPTGARVALLQPVSSEHWTRGLLAALCAGATLKAPPAVDAPPASGWAKWLESFGAQVAHVGGPALPPLCAELRGPPGQDLPAALQTVVVDAREASRSAIATLLSRAQDQRVVGVWGAAGELLGRPLGASDLEAAALPAWSEWRSLGARLLDADGVLLAPSMKGRLGLAVRGASSGFWRRPRLTAELLVPDAAGVGGAVRLTRDLATLEEDGRLLLRGRVARSVQRGGIEANLTGLEAMLIQSREVDDVALLEDDADGGGGLTAHVVAAHEGATREEIEEVLRRRLPSPLVPGEVRLVAAIPRGPRGGVDVRALLREPSRPSPAPRPGREEETVVRLHGPVDLESLERATTALCSRHPSLRRLDEPPETGASQERLGLRVGPEEGGAHDVVLTLSSARLGWGAQQLERAFADEYRWAVASSGEPQPTAIERERPRPDVLAYWRRALDGVEPLELPRDRARPGIQSFRGRTITRVLGEAQLGGMSLLCEQAQVSERDVLLASVQAMLGRLGGTDDVVVGLRASATERTHAPHRAQPLPVRLSLSGNPSFREIVTRAREATDAALQHDVSLVALVEALDPVRDMSQAPFFQVTFRYAEDLAGAGNGNSDESVVVHHDLELELARVGSELRIAATYCDAIFEPSTVSLWLEGVCDVIRRGLSSGGAARVVGLTDSRDAVGAEDVASQAPPECVTKRFEENALRSPDRVAVVWGDETVSYGELRERVLRQASVVSRLPVRTGRVGLVFNKGPEMVTAVLAALYGGRAYVALDASYPAARLKLMVEKAGCDALLCAEETRQLAARLANDAVPLIDVCASVETRLDGPSSSDPSDEAYVLFTSGSTGVPKGVVQTRGNLAHYVDVYAERAEIGPDDRLSLISAFSFDAAISDTFGALIRGAAILPYELKSAGVAALPGFIRDHAVTVYHSTPTVFRALLDATRDPSDLASVRIAVLGGEAVTNGDLELFRRSLPAHARLVNNLGASECSISLWATFDASTRISGRLPMGRPVERTRVLLLDETGAESFVGQLVVQSEHLALGYLDADASAQVFSTVGGRRSYVSGDYAYRRPDGHFVSLGRRDRQVKVRGNRIELGEVEAAVRKHPDVTRAAAAVHRIGGPSDDEGILCAYAESARDVDRETLRAQLMRVLPGYMVPSQIFVVRSLPLTPSGKIDYAALAGIRESIMRATAARRVERPPTTELENAIAEALCFGLAVDAVGVDDHFFDDLGGSSLGLVRAAGQLSEKLGREVRSILLFEYPRISLLAPVIAGEATSVAEEAVPAVAERNERRQKAIASRRKRRRGKK